MRWNIYLRYLLQHEAYIVMNDYVYGPMNLKFPLTTSAGLFAMTVTGMIAADRQ
jgi:hypothetical protein